MCVLPCLYGCHSHEGICRDQKVQASFTGVQATVTLPWGCMVLNSSPLKEQRTFLTESFFQVLLLYFVFCSSTGWPCIWYGIWGWPWTLDPPPLPTHGHGEWWSLYLSPFRPQRRGWWHSVWTSYTVFLSYWVTPEEKWQSNWKSYWRFKLASKKRWHQARNNRDLHGKGLQESLARS